MRLCIANGKRAMFHCWEQVSEVIPPSPMRNGHQGGTVRHTVGIVEYEDGNVERLQPEEIFFLDSRKLFAKAEREFEKWEAKQTPVKDLRLVANHPSNKDRILPKQD